MIQQFKEDNPNSAPKKKSSKKRIQNGVSPTETCISPKKDTKLSKKAAVIKKGFDYSGPSTPNENEKQ